MALWLAVIVFTGVVAWVGMPGLQKRFPSLHASESFGLVGITALLLTGWLTFFFGLIGDPGKGSLFSFVIALLLCIGLEPKMPKAFVVSPKQKPFLVGFVALFLIPVINSLAPSSMLDWDTLAYHFAVPQLWIKSGNLDYIPFIHQSNFPFIVDNLFLIGLELGSDTASKAFTLLYLFFGTFWLRGFLARHFEEQISLYGVLIWLATPLTLWLSGSGYIDVVHGLLSALGLIYLAESLSDEKFSKHILLAGIGLGGALASKYTGLQVCAIAFVFLVTGIAKKQLVPKTAVISVFVALVIGSPWYVRNEMNTGNPVFPFFYKQLGGKNWDSWRSEIYTDEQKSFGFSPSPANLGHATLGLTYQSGRFVNPGQQSGFGVQLGSIGLISLLAGLGYGLIGKRDRLCNALALMALGQIGLWFLLSQQVRYLTAILPIFAVLGCAILINLKKQQVFGFATIGLQSLYSLFTLYQLQTANQIPVALGAVDRQAYQDQQVPFAKFAREINTIVPKTGKLALYDEVFGYFLDCDYFWANPGHSTLLRQEPGDTGQQYVNALRANGLTHIYVKRNFDNQEIFFSYLTGQPLSPESEQKFNGKASAWLLLIKRAMEEGEIKIRKEFGARTLLDGTQSAPSAILFEVNPAKL